MVKSFLLFLSLIIVFQAKAQPVIDCYSKVVQDSLVHIYEKKASKYGFNHPNHPHWEETWDSLLTICPNVAEAYHEKAVPYIRNGDYAKAFEFEEKAVDLDPKRWIAYYAFMNCIFSKNYEKALIEFNRADTLVPNASVMDHTYSFYRGISYLELNELDKAELEFLKDIRQQRRSNEHNDIHFNSLLYLGIVYSEMKEFDKAEKYFRDCLQQYEQLPEANYYLAQTLKIIGNREYSLYFEKAKQYFSAGFRINEPTEMYVNYPRQISEQELAAKN